MSDPGSERPLVDPADSAVFHRELNKTYPLMVRAEGRTIWDSSGRAFLDAASGGAAVTVIGYGNKHVQAEAARQMAELPYVHNAKFTNLQQERLARRLASHAPSGVARTFFVQGGAEANEAALRLIRRYHVDRGEPQRDIVVTQTAAYHGSTVGTLALSGRKSLQEPVGPWLPPFEHFAAFHCYRCPYGKQYGTCGIECAHVLDSIAERVGPGRIAAFMMETVPTSAGAGLVPPPEFLPIVREWCDRIGALLVLDEVLTGMGRTGRWFATEHWGVVPDAMTIAKGLGAGYTPIGALMVHQRVYDAIDDASRDFEHGHTLNGNPLSCAVGNAVLDVIEEQDLVSRSASLGAWLKERLAEKLADLDHVGEVRGLGTLIGIEYVRSRSGKEITDPASRFTASVMQYAFEDGLLISGTGNNAEVNLGECTILVPAYTTTDAEAEVIVEKVARAIRRASERLDGSVRTTSIPIAIGHGSPALASAPSPKASAS